MNKKFVVGVALTTLAVAACVSTPKSTLRTIASTDSAVEEIAKQGLIRASGQADGMDFASAPWKARSLDNAFLQKVSSAANVKLVDGQLLTDNDLAFDKKLDVINSARKSLRMVYFIYADDDSSSKINDALMTKAKQGVKVDLLVDFVTNFKNLDLFTMLESQSNGNLTVHFYNVPPSQMYQDANYVVLPCPAGKPSTSADCFNSKKATMDKMARKDIPTPFAKLLLTGIYGRSATALKLALGYGAEIDPKSFKGAAASSEEDKEAMVEFAKLVSEAVIQDSLIAKIKLSIAMTAYEDKLNPIINELTGRLPIRSMEANASHGALWDHLSDYTHHKLLAADGEQFVLGGRNIEDSYHMDQRVGSKGKYIFVDTDFWGQTKAGGLATIEKSYDDIIKSSMVWKLSKVKQFYAYDFIANVSGNLQAPGAGEMAVGYCLQQKSPDLGGCILAALSQMPGYKSEQARVAEKMKELATHMDRYESAYVRTGLKKNTNQFGKLSANDVNTAELFYLENINFNKKNGNRYLGSKIGAEADYGKNIHAVWYRGLENACKVSREQKREVRVIFNTAYLIMPSGMVHKIAQMMNNDLGDCSRVRLQFITNSPLTTDLGPINVLARYQLGALFDHYRTLVNYKAQFESRGVVRTGDGETSYASGGFTYRQFWPKIEYYEMKPTEGVGTSLHTKTTLIGEDLIVGSANADVRSYYMDSNNAMLIRNAHDLNAQYRAEIDRQISSGAIEDKMESFVGRSIDQLRAENDYMLKAFAKRWKQEKRLTPERITAILNNLDHAGRDIYSTTKSLLVYRGEFDQERMNSSEGGGNTYRMNKELNDKANKFDGRYKVF